MLLRELWLSCLAVVGAYAQSSSINPTNNPISASITSGDTIPSTVRYLSYSSTIILSTTTGASNSSGNANNTALLGSSATSQSLTLIGGGGGSRTTTATGNGTRTAGAPTASNTQPCNNYPELCQRSYGNITEVCAHNSPFAKKGNAASNQVLDVINQLDDGIRMLQGQTHLINGTLRMCHTSCNILDAGTLQDYLTTVAGWVRSHPYDVLTILLANGDYSGVGNFTAPILNSGLGPYLYTPPKIPMGVNDWPTLSQMILTGKRVVVFMDYEANQTAVPYVLDQFSQMWETPFDPTNITFPCVVQRPPGINRQQALDRMYMINHNLNIELNYLSVNILIPNLAYVNVTNGVSGEGSLGVSTNNCIADWGRPPNWLLVDYYNYGSPINGSVFEVAARANGVTYNRKCCGLGPQSGAPPGMLRQPAGLVLGVAAAAVAALAALA